MSKAQNPVVPAGGAVRPPAAGLDPECFCDAAEQGTERRSDSSWSSCRTGSDDRKSSSSPPSSSPSAAPSSSSSAPLGLKRRRRLELWWNRRPTRTKRRSSANREFSCLALTSAHLFRSLVLASANLMFYWFRVSVCYCYIYSEPSFFGLGSNKNQ